MKLLNQSIKHISISILAIIGIWGVVFFFNMIAEIKENVDDGLDNYKRQIIYKAHQDTTLLSRIDFDEGFYSIREINREKALHFKDQYSDTLVYIQDIQDLKPTLDPTRMLTTAFQDGGKYYELKVINPMVEKDDLIERLLWNMIWLYAILIITIVLINNMVLQRLWKPFYGLLHQLQQFRLGSGQQLPQVQTKTKEFLDLQEAVGLLLNHNIQIYEQQKQFIGNASHELQTPLAIAMNKLELLIEKEELKAEQVETIAETMHIIERLIRLNKSLLLLSKIENKQFPNAQPVQIAATIAQGQQDLSEIANFKEVQFIVDSTSNLTKMMDPALAEIMIYNLLRNAIFHNMPNGKVWISLRKNELCICNTGRNKALDITQIFKRFYKSQPKKGSTGLGLSIVKAIGDLYGISITYTFSNQRHCFRLTF